MAPLSSILCALVLSLLCGCSSAFGEEDFSFDLEEFEKKPLSVSGYLELKGEHMDINEQGAFARLNGYQAPRSTADRARATVQLEGNANKSIVDFNWLIQAYGQQDQQQWTDEAVIFDAYASIKPTPLATLELGKKVFKWGKGYAWNPVAFIDRVKDPNNPEEAMEGYAGLGLDLIKSYPAGPLQTLALTTVALPVWSGVNEDFGARDNMNLAAKLYVLYRDIDFDCIFFTGNSKTTRYGLDFSTNLASNFELHGEIAHIPRQKQKILNSAETIESRISAETSYLLGLRYLFKRDMTTIVEYYHNDHGYSVEEFDRFYSLVTQADAAYNHTGDTSLYQRSAQLAQGAYGIPQAGRNYLYVRVTQKEPFNLLYFTPGCTAIINLDDRSFSISPEAIYTGITNWEIKLRLALLQGSPSTEFGEKINANRIELRLRYFF